MSIIDHYPVGHDSVEIIVATAFSSGAITAIRVTLRSVGVLADPLLFVTDNSLEQEILSKGGFDEELDVTWDEGVLASTEQHGPYYVYLLTYSASQTCSS